MRVRFSFSLFPRKRMDKRRERGKYRTVERKFLEEKRFIFTRSATLQRVEILLSGETREKRERGELEIRKENLKKRKKVWEGKRKDFFEKCGNAGQERRWCQFFLNFS